MMMAVNTVRRDAKWYEAVDDLLDMRLEKEQNK